MDAKDCTKSEMKPKGCISIACKAKCVVAFGFSAKGECITKSECQCTFPC